MYNKHCEYHPQFGDLQIEITPVKANIGAVIALVFG